MTSHQGLFAALAAPFEPTEVKVRDHAGRQLHYVTARTVMNRLDSVLGPENWSDDYVPGQNSVLCRLTIRLPDGSTLTKCDAGGYAGMADSGDDDKSGFSDSFKRAGVKFGIGRYLYRDGVPTFVQEAAAEAAAPKAQAKAPARMAKAQEPAIELPEAWGQTRSLAVDFLRWLEKTDPSRKGVYRAVMDAGKAAKLPVRVLGWDRDAIARGYRFALAQLEAQSQARTQPAQNGKH